MKRAGGSVRKRAEDDRHQRVRRERAARGRPSAEERPSSPPPEPESATVALPDTHGAPVPMKLSDAQDRTIATAEIFAHGLDYWQKGMPLAALKCFEVAHEAEPDNARFCSFYGLVLGDQRGLHRRSVELCQQAVKAEPTNTTFRLNLAKALVAAEQKAEAVDTLREGLDLVDDRASLQPMLETLGIRKPPVFKALPRSHPFNKYVGILLFRLGLR